MSPYRRTPATTAAGGGGGAPDPHAASHADGGSDEVTLTQDQITGLVAALAAKAPLVRRVVTLTASSNTYTPNADTTDEALIVTPGAAFTIAAPTGTPNDGQRMEIRIRSGATGYVPTWNAIYADSGVAARPTTALPASKTVTVFLKYDATAVKWVVMAADLVGY